MNLNTLFVVLLLASVAIGNERMTRLEAAGKVTNSQVTTNVR
jgi:hypothetical protein